jgi:FKBP-type peptidyl-prolyl cis-trans isomerase
LIYNGGKAWGPMVLGNGDAVQAYDLGLGGMCVGERRQIVSEARYAYGDQGWSNEEGVRMIPPGARLTFYVTLHSLEKKQTMEEPLPEEEPIPVQPPQKTDFEPASWDMSAEVNQLKVEVLRAKPECTVRTVTGSTVQVHYNGRRHKDGFQFETSYGKQPWGPFTIGAGQAIQAYEHGLVNMCVGEKWRIIAPASYAYGEHGSGANIPPHAALVFDVELMSMEEEKLLVNYIPPHCPWLVQKKDTTVFFKYDVKSAYGEGSYAYKVGQLDLDSAAAGDTYERLFADMCEGEQRKLFLPPHRKLSGFVGLLDIPEWETTIWLVTLQRFQRETLVIDKVYSGECGAKTNIGDSVALEFNVSLSLDDKEVVMSSWDLGRHPHGSYRFTIGDDTAVEGLDQGVYGMCVGDRRTLVIPPSLAYGGAGLPGTIPANASVIFDIELVGMGFDRSREWPTHPPLFPDIAEGGG